MSIFSYIDYDESNYVNNYKNVTISEDGTKLVGVPTSFEGVFEIPDGVKIIGSSAFKSCKLLNEIIIPETVEEIGGFAFWGCRMLKEVNLPKSLKILGGAAFANSWLKRIVIPSGVCKIYEHYIMVDDHSSDVYWYGSSSYNEVPEYTGLFDECSSLEYVEINAPIEEISDQMFNGCGKLKTIVLPDSVRSIKDSPFKRCDNLKEIVFKGTERQWSEISGIRKVGNIHVSCMG